MTWLSDGTVSHLREVVDQPDLSGTRYELRERIGQGGMGSVYRVRDTALGRDVALKIVRGAEVSPEAAARLLREAQTLARLEHPGIVPVHDVGTLADGRVFYAMKLVRGEELDERLRGGSTLPELVRVLQRVCEAVAFAHSHGVIHRDLKPGNVMIGAFGEVLVLDWGVAKVRAQRDSGHGPAPAREVPPPAGSPSTGQGSVLGTPGYMAPEQASGAVDLTDQRTDVYALGAMLRDVLRMAPAQARRHGAPIRPLAAIVARAMAHDPAQRYPSAEALAADLAAWLEGRPVAALRETVFDRLRRVAWKYRTPILLVLAYLLMRVVLLALTGR